MFVASTASDWATVAVTAFVGVAGVVVAVNIRKDLKLKVAERRLTSYERLWALMRTVSPYNEPLDAHGRQDLHDRLTDWYYSEGDGMLLEDSTKRVYLAAKDNLVRPLEQIVPKQASDRIARESAELEVKRSQLSQRQLSLLRTQMKSDLAVYGLPYREGLDAEDRAFLSDCGVDPTRRPWT